LRIAIMGSNGPAPESSVDIATLRFLVVEDHGFQRWALQRMLQDLGAQFVYTAQDGLAALEVLASLDHPIDIVVSDLDMPGMDGMEFIRRIGEEGRPLSLMVLSSHEPTLLASVESLAQAYKVNLLAAVRKPATPAKLQAAIAAYPRSRVAPAAAAEHVFSPRELEEGLDTGQLVAYYQPKLDMKTGLIVGAEALARWEHPRKGLVAPRHFVPAMESAGLITRLTESMLAMACKASRAWHAAGSTAHFSINLSVASLADLTLADRFMKILDGEGVRPQNVIMEVTESAATTELGKSLENLSRLRMRGFGLAIDDYGTGYSSMQQLSRIPFTELKIDQSFVLNASSHAPSRAMLESSLELAAKLKIGAVAEGVETHREWQLVRSLGCDMAQGFFGGRPMPLAEFTALATRPPQGAPR
jgi:EAL domain-containing protein (putative c-di-GMP-specific phosphodiesterase class I)/CheY-like chemotaxis protein